MREEVVLGGDAAPDDFTVFVAARGPALQRFAYLVAGDAAESADLVQDALERAWPRWSTLVATGTCEAYLKRSIANGAVSRWRKIGRVRPVAEPIGHDVVGIPLNDADDAWQLCAGLPPNQRAAVVLRFYEDLTYDEIAAILDCAEATARSHVHRALAALRIRLTEETRDDR